MTRALRFASVLLSSGAILGACGSSGGPAAAPAAAPAGAAVASAASVDLQGFAFAPAALQVAKGTKVTWTNKDAIAHTVTSGTAAAKDGKFDANVAAGATFSFTFADAGTFAYLCTIHPTMTGTVTVK